MNRRQKLVQQQFLNNERAVITRLQHIYDQSLFEVNAKIRNLEFQIGDMTEQLDWLDDDDPEKARIKSKIQSKIYQKQYQEQLQAQLDGILQKMQTNQYLTVSDYLNECYEDGFIGAIFDQHGQGVPLMMPINQEAMVDAVQLESKISEGLYTRLGEDVATLKKRIAADVTRGIATGAGWKQVAQQLANQTRVGYNRAVRIARTEGHRIQNTAIMNAAEDAKERGADLVKQWDATLDGKTRESHVAVDGQIRELNEKFGNGLEYPGDPAGGAAEVVNCRCVMLQRARWAVGGSFTKFNNFTKQLETFESPESYDEFKKGFFSPENKKYMNYVQQMEEKYGTKDFEKVLGMMNTREYNHYTTLLQSNPVYNKTKGGRVGDVTDAFSRKMSIMTYTEDLSEVNPNFNTGEFKWTHNCQRCVSTYEMRRRGYDVTAKPLPGKVHEDHLANYPGAAWQNSVPIPCVVGSGKKEVEKHMMGWGDGARSIVSVRWPGRNVGHVFIAEQRNGKTCFIDPQTNDSDCSEYFKDAAKGCTYIVRIDDLLPNEYILDCCEDRK